MTKKTYYLASSRQKRSLRRFTIAFSLAAGALPLASCSGAEDDAGLQDDGSAHAPASPSAVTPKEGDRRGGTLGTLGALTLPEQRADGGEQIGRLQSELNIGQDTTTTGSVANGVTIDVLRSAMVNDAGVLAGFSFQSVLDQLIASSGRPGLTSLGLYQQLFRTLTDTPASSNDPRCSPQVNGFPNEGCPRVPDGDASTENPFTPNTPGFHFPTALVNRVDLIPTDGAHCGEYRVIFARNSGTDNTSGVQEAFLIFEAVMPNPRLDLGLEGCRPIPAFWRDLSTVSSVAERTRRLKAFYFEGLPGFRPVLHVLNYGEGLGSTGGRVRLSSGRTRPWQFYEYKLDCGSVNPCNLVARPVTNKETPNEELFDTSTAPVPGSVQDRYQQNLVSNVRTLAINDVNRFFLASAPDEFNAADSRDRDNIPFDSLFRQGPSTTFRNRLQTELTRIGSSLTPENIVVRAESLACHGCHATSTGDAGMGANVMLPLTTAVHVGPRKDAANRFPLSEAVANVFLPHRRNTMVRYLNSANSLRALKVSTAPLIDGNLNEPSWNLTNNASKLVSGSSDNDAVWSATWNNTHLFLGARVSDGNLFNDSGGNFWDDDGVELYIDGNRERSTTYDSNDRQYTVRYNDVTVREKANRTSGVLAAWAPSNGGYSVELAIPWTTIGVTASAGKQLGFDVGINDDDNGSTRDGQLMGLGTSTNYQNTSAFATISLDGGAAPTALSSRILPTREAPAIDGHLGDSVWNLRYEPHKRSAGTLSNRVRWAVAHSDTHFMVAAFVKDASLRNDSANVVDDDSFELYIDGARNRSTTYDANDLYFVKGYNDSTLFEKNGRTSGVLHASKALPGGYGVEIAVPWARLGYAARPAAGTLIGIDVGVNDDGNGGTRDGAAVWFGDGNNSASTARFGDLSLAQ